MEKQMENETGLYCGLQGTSKAIQNKHKASMLKKEFSSILGPLMDHSKRRRIQ